MTIPTFLLERTVPSPVVGVDEAGCGPWAGPVVAGAVIFRNVCDKAPLFSLLNDSKKLTLKRREKAYAALLDAAQEGLLYYAVGQASVKEVDCLNIRQAALLAMKRAVETLPVMPAFAFIDGTMVPKLTCPSQSVIRGDSTSYSIAAASIFAKVTRDRLMADLAEECPGYGWEKNAGYGTKLHQEGLERFGVTPHHRLSFAPVRRFYEMAANSA